MIYQITAPDGPQCSAFSVELALVQVVPEHLGP